MKLFIAGKDRSKNLGKELIHIAQQRPDLKIDRQINEVGDILDIKSSVDINEYTNRHITTLRSRNCINTSSMSIPSKGGFFNRLIYLTRYLFWKILRHQYDWMAFKQNTINIQLAYQLEFEKELREKQFTALEKKINKLKSKIKGTKE